MACQLHSVDFGPNVDRVTRVHPECQFAYSCVDQLCDSAWTAAMVRFPPAHNSFVRLDFNQYSVAVLQHGQYRDALYFPPVPGTIWERRKCL